MRSSEGGAEERRQESISADRQRKEAAGFPVQEFFLFLLYFPSLFCSQWHWCLQAACCLGGCPPQFCWVVSPRCFSVTFSTSLCVLSDLRLIFTSGIFLVYYTETLSTSLELESPFSSGGRAGCPQTERLAVQIPVSCCGQVTEACFQWGWQQLRIGVNSSLSILVWSKRTLWLSDSVRDHSKIREFCRQSSYIYFLDIDNTVLVEKPVSSAGCD